MHYPHRVPPVFNIVLHEPQIPNNTGNIGRTCIATGCALHLIHPLGFSTSEKACRRAGLDYWPRLNPAEHQSWGAYLAAAAPDPGRMWFLTTKAARPVWDAPFRAGDHLVFGRETAGLPDEMLARYADRLITLPMVPTERSLNLATAVCAVVYEGLRQVVGAGAARVDQGGRLVLP